MPWRPSRGIVGNGGAFHVEKKSLQYAVNAHIGTFLPGEFYPMVKRCHLFFHDKGADRLEHNRLRRLIFFALCCDLGLVSKRLIAPIANVITDSLHIPGGIGTSFSLMFLVLAAALLPRFGCATLMGRFSR